MGRLVKLLVYLVIFAAIGLVAYAYLGPFLGADFSAPTTHIQIPIILDAQ